MPVFDKIHAFAEKWLPILRSGDKVQVSKDLGHDCRDLGFVMDLGFAWMSLCYSGEPSGAFSSGESSPFAERGEFHDRQMCLFTQIESVQVLCSAIYSAWRHFHSWPGLPWNTDWFLSAMTRLEKLTACPEFPPKQIEDLHEEMRLGKAPRNPLQALLFGKYGAVMLGGEISEGFDVEQRDDHGRTLLMYCGCAPKYSLSYLLKEHADCSAVDNDGNTVLMYLCDTFDLKEFDEVLKHGADINAKNHAGLTVLDFAMMQGLPLTPFLQRGAKLERLPMTYLPEVVGKTDRFSEEVFALLLKNGQIFSLEFLFGLLYQYPEVWTDLVVRLSNERRVQKYQLPNHKFFCRESFFDRVLKELQIHLSKDGRNLKTVFNCFLGTTIDWQHNTFCDLLNLAIEMGYYGAIEELLKDKHPDCKITCGDNKFEHTSTRTPVCMPLMTAVKKKDLTAIRLLLEHGASPTTGDSKYGSDTALEFAIRENEMEIFTLLLEHGADVNFSLQPGHSPMYWAVKCRRPRMQKLLLAHGARPVEPEPEIAPVVPPHSVHLMRTKVAGTFAISGKQYVFSEMKPGNALELRREPYNEHDSNAISIWWHGFKMGYVPRTIAEDLAPEMDDDVCIFGRVAEVDREKREIFADLFQRELLPLDEMTGFTFTKHGGYPSWPLNKVQYSLSLRQRKFVHEVMIWREEVQRFEIVFSEKEWQHICDKLEKCNFLAWEKDYTEKEMIVCDAPYWNLALRLKGNRVFRSHGDVNTPEEWCIFQEFLGGCRDLSQIRGNGSFRVIPWAEFLKEAKKSKRS